MRARERSGGQSQTQHNTSKHRVCLRVRALENFEIKIPALKEEVLRWLTEPTRVAVSVMYTHFSVTRKPFSTRWFDVTDII
jgi:hypothetical protein